MEPQDATAGAGPATMNYAGDSAQVGVQATTVHGGIHYYSQSVDASPAEKFELGVRLLNGGMPGKARQLIHEAVMAGHVGNDVCFYWQLALVSGRTRHEMSREDTEMLRRAPTTCRVTGGDQWADGVKTLCRLLDAMQQPDVDLRPLLKDFDGLAPTPHAMLLRHLELFLDGPLKDRMWQRALRNASELQMAGDRAGRVWKFFQPDPAGPRFREVRPAEISAGTWARAIAGTAVLAAALLYIAFLLARGLQVYALLVYLLSVAAGCLAARGGLEWRSRLVRRRTADERFATPRARAVRPPPGGFASRVDQSFERYFARYVPRHASRPAWLAETAGIRRSIRDEIVEVYREQRVGVERIDWLIRHRVGEIRRQWENGTLFAYRRELATPPAAKALVLAGLAITVLGGARTLESAARVALLNTVWATVVALAAGAIAGFAWQRIVHERRRYAADSAEFARTEERSHAAFERWKRKLADKPTDPEMAAWLDRDRKVLLNEALRHYGLAMSDMIAHAFIEAPGPRTKRARVRNGPWRYTRYELLLFLLTTDGVRQLSAELDFTQGTFHGWNRVNYRYEAVAAVRVRQPGDEERRFELALVNGEQISVEVMAPGREELQEDESPGVVSEVTMDAAGLHHTLHVMEGIAAEGKRWIAQERRRKGDR